MAGHRTLVAYDIPSASVRRKVADELARWGDREQKSVFLVQASGEHLGELRGRLLALASGPQDKVLLVSLCGTCESGQHRIGYQVGEQASDASWWAVV